MNMIHRVLLHTVIHVPYIKNAGDENLVCNHTWQSAQGLALYTQTSEAVPRVVPKEDIATSPQKLIKYLCKAYAPIVLQFRAAT